MYRSTKVKSLYIHSKHFIFFFIIFEFEEQDPIEEDASILQRLQFVQMYCSTNPFSFVIFLHHFRIRGTGSNRRGCFNSSMFTIRTNILFNKSYIQNIRHFFSSFSNSRSKIQSKRMLQFFNILFYNSYKNYTFETFVIFLHHFRIRGAGSNRRGCFNSSTFYFTILTNILLNKR